MVAVTLPRGRAIISTLTRATTLTNFRQLYSLSFLKVFMLPKIDSLLLLRLNRFFFDRLRPTPATPYRCPSKNHPTLLKIPYRIRTIV